MGMDNFGRDLGRLVWFLVVGGIIAVALGVACGAGGAALVLTARVW